jgi:(S)-sulfolactate dehydrogenase
MTKIVITEFMDQAAVADLSSDHDVVYDPALVDDRSALLKHIADAEGLIVRNRTQVDRSLLDRAPKLQAVGRLGVGMDNIDLAACTDRSVAVHPATGANADAVAEYVIAAVLTLVRGAFLASDRVVLGEWPRTELSGLEVRGRTMGLLGLGDIARRVAVLSQALGMEVIASDPFVPDTDAVWSTVRSVEFAELVSTSDAISLHVPLTDTTEQLFGRAEFASMKEDAVLVNTARGGIVDEGALIDALRGGTIRGAAIDVFESEPLTPALSASFDQVPNLILTPHIAGVTEESNRRVSAMVASKVRAALAEGDE